jgi:hypothetical protein
MHNKEERPDKRKVRFIVCSVAVREQQHTTMTAPLWIRVIPQSNDSTHRPLQTAIKDDN